MPKDITEVSSIEELEALLKADPTDDNDPDESPADDTDTDSNSPETDENQETHEPSESNFDEYLLSLNPEDLLRKHPGLQGKFGALVDKNAREIAARERAEERRRQQEAEERQEEEELVRLAREDPESAAPALAERIARQRNQKANNERETQIRQEYGSMLDSEMNAIYETPIMAEFANVMSDEQLATLWWKNGRYNSFASWAENMLRTVREFGREEGRREVSRSALETNQRQPAASTRSAPKPRGQAEGFSAGLGERVESVPGQYKPGDVRKMDFGTYAKNRDNILESIFEED